MLNKLLLKGKHNGLIIDGVDIRFRITLLNWKIFYFNKNGGQPIICFLCFKFNLSLNYHRLKFEK